MKALGEWSTSTRDGIDKPKVSYTADILELKKLKDYGEIESFQIGDSGKMYDPGIEVDTTQRIVGYEYYPYEPKQSVIELANYDISKKITYGGMLAGLIQSKQNFEKIKTAQGTINAAWLENIRSKLQTEINTVMQNALMHDQADLYVDNVNNPTKAIMIGSGIFAIANSKKANGDWNWRTIATGDKVIADEVNALWVYAGAIKASQIDVSEGKITANQIDVTDLVAERIRHPSSENTYGVMGGTYGDLILFYNNTEFFRIYNGLDGVSFKCNGLYFLSSSGNITQPQHTWDCRNAIFTGLFNGSSWYATQQWVQSKDYLTGSGISGMFTTVDGKTVTVSNGLVTSIA
jgi:hypothetical protein